MKLKHWFFVALVIVGGLYVWHIYSGHGGTQGFKAGLGIQ
jgi:hypothetical protein